MDNLRQFTKNILNKKDPKFNLFTPNIACVT